MTEAETHVSYIERYIMKEALVLIVLVAIAIQCKPKIVIECEFSRSHSAKVEIDHFTQPKISPIFPNVFYIGGKQKKQGRLINDSLIIEKYQDKLFPRYYVHDKIDSLFIQAGLNKRAFIYDQKTDKWHNLKSRKFAFVHLTETHILLFGYDGFYKVDKTNFKLSKVKDCPQDYFSRRPIVKSHKLYFKSGWSYDVITTSWDKIDKVSNQPDYTEIIYDDLKIKMRKRGNKYEIELDSIKRVFGNKPFVRDNYLW